MQWIVKPDDFHVEPSLPRDIAAELTELKLTASHFPEQANSMVARHVDRPYVNLVYASLEKALYEPCELEADKPLNDYAYTPGTDSNEPLFLMRRRQWFANILDGEIHHIQDHYKPLMAALGTVCAIHKPHIAKGWSFLTAQRIDVWNDYDRRQSERYLQVHGRIARLARRR